MRVLFGCVAALLSAQIAAAQSSMVPVAPDRAVDRVTLHDLIDAALKGNPDLAAAAARYDAARQRPAQERSLPDPMLSVGYNSSGNPLPGAGLGSEPTANIGVMVTQELPYPGKRDLRASVASKEADAEAQQIDATRLTIVSRVKQAYYRLAYTYAVEEVLTRNKSLLDTLLKVSEARYGVGRAAQQDVFKAQAELTLVELKLQQVRQERATREAELNALRNQPPGTALGRPADLELPSFDVAVEKLLASAATEAPMLRRDQVMVDRAQIAIESARRDFKPDFGVTAGYYNMGAMPSMYMFRFDVKVPLQRARRASAVGEQLDLLAGAQRTRESTLRAIEARVQEDYAMATTSLRLARLYRDTVLPQVRLALESSMASYETGSVDFLSVLTNFGSVLEYEMTYFDELTAFHTAASRLEEMTGVQLGH